MAKSKSTRATERKPTAAEVGKARRRLARPRLIASECADALKIDLIQIRASLMSAVLAIENTGSTPLKEVGTMLRMSGLRAIERAFAVVEGMS